MIYGPDVWQVTFSALLPIYFLVCVFCLQQGLLLRTTFLGFDFVLSESSEFLHFLFSWLCLLMGVREFIYPAGQQAFWQQKSSSALPVPNKGPMNKLLNNISSRYLSTIYSLSGFCPAASFICLAPTVCSYKLSQFLPFWHLFVPLSSLLVSCATWPSCALSLSLLLLLLSHLYVFLLLLLFSLQSVISFFPSSTMSWLSFPIRKSGI